MPYKNILKTAIFACITLLLVSGCGNSGSSSSGGSGIRITKLLVIGDSIGNGFGIATPYSVRVAGAKGVPLINDSVSNRQAGGGAAIVAGLLAAHQPSHMIVLLGTNDALRGSVGGALVNLQIIINAGVAAGVTVIVGTLPPLVVSSDANFRAGQISDGIRGLGGAGIAEIRNAMGNGSTTIADGIHPNDNGQQIIADEFLKHLE